MSKWNPPETAPLDGSPILLDWGQGTIMVGEWSTEYCKVGAWQGVIVTPSAPRSFTDSDDPEDAPEARFCLGFWGGDLLGWMLLPKSAAYDA